MQAHLDREVKAGRLSSEEADRRFEEMKERSDLKDRVTQEIHQEMEEEMETVMREAQEGELTEEEAREEIEQMRMHFQHEIRMAHMEIELDAEESRLDEAVADGRLSEDEMEERMVKMQERMERAQDEFHQRLEEDGHDRDDHHEEHSHWEDEEELWARVADGLKAAVALAGCRKARPGKFGRNGGRKLSLTKTRKSTMKKNTKRKTETIEPKK